MDQILDQKAAIKDLLKQNSRSFALTLLALPRQQRSFVGLTYLVARIADTLADSGNWKQADRKKALNQWKSRVFGDENRFEIEASLGGFKTKEAELLLEADHVARMWRAFSKRQLEIGEELLETLFSAMEWQVQTFGQATPEEPVFGIQTEEELDFYCYQHAGCVGRFWVQIFSLPVHLEPLAISYGKALERLNILRDVIEDREQGRILLPQSLLQKFEINQKEPWKDARQWPLFVKEYSKKIDAGLKHGAQFVDSLSWLSFRLRWASMMPLKIAKESLELYLDESSKSQTTKISRSIVKRLIFESFFDSFFYRKVSKRIR